MDRRLPMSINIVSDESNRLSPLRVLPSKIRSARSTPVMNHESWIDRNSVIQKQDSLFFSDRSLEEDMVVTIVIWFGGRQRLERYPEGQRHSTQR